MKDENVVSNTVTVLKPIKNHDGYITDWIEYEVDKETAMEQLNKPANERNAHWKLAKLKGDVQTELTPEEKIKFDAYMKSMQAKPVVPDNSEAIKKEYEELAGKKVGNKKVETLVKEMEEIKSKLV